MTWRATTLLAGAVALAALAAIADMAVAYRYGPAAAVVLPAAALAVALVVRDPLFGVCGALVSVPLETFGISGGGVQAVTASQGLLLVTAAVVGVRMVLDGTALPLHPVHRLGAALVAVLALGWLVAEDPAVVVRIGVNWAALLLVSAYVASLGPREVERVLLSIAIAAGLVGAAALSSAGDQELVAGGAIATGRAQGAFDQPNLLGFFLALSIPPALVMSTRGGTLQRLALRLAVAAAAGGLLLSLSRTSIIGTGLALGVMLSWPSFRRTAGVGLAALSLFALVNADALLESRQVQVVGQRLGTLVASGVATDDGRTEMYARTPEIVLDHPFLGVGAGQYAAVSRGYGIEDPDGLAFDHAHNVPLTIGAELGLPGLLLLVTGAGWLVVTGVRGLRRRTAPTWPLLLGVAAGLSTTAVTGMGDYPLRANAILALILIEAGALVALARIAGAPDRPGATSTPPSPRR